MKQLMIALMLAIGISSVAMSLFGNHGQRLDWDQLNLSDQQTQEVQAIRKTYRDEFQRLRKHDIDTLAKKNQLLELRDTMVASMSQVLSVEQRQQAGEMMIEQAEKRINKRLDRLADKLALTAQQQNAMRAVVSTNLVESPAAFLTSRISNIKQSQYVFDQVNEFMPNILSSRQLLKWQKIKGKRTQDLAS
jgi:hypothetical protein